MMISVDAPNHYEVLGVAKDATPDEIRAAHRRLVHQVHTDKGGTDALFRQVQAAYEALSDPDSRAAYDRQLRAGSTGSGFDDNAPGWRRVDNDSPAGGYRREPPPSGGPASSAPPPPPPPSDVHRHEASPPPWAQVPYPRAPANLFARHPSAVVCGVGFLLLMIGTQAGAGASGIAFIGFIVALLGASGLLGHRRAAARDSLRRAALPDIDLMTGAQFELRLVEAFRRTGYQVRHVGGTRDLGSDLIVEKAGVRAVVQAKRQAARVGQPAVREAAAARAHYSAHRSMVVTNSYFTQTAIVLAASNDVELWDRDALSRFISVQSAAAPRTGVALLGDELSAGLPVALKGLGTLVVGIFAVLSQTGSTRRRPRRRR